MVSRALIGLCLLLAASPAFANCEVGGYWIHTLAEYQPSDPERSVLPYWKESATRVGFAENGVTAVPAELQSPALRLLHHGKSCAPSAHSGVDRYDTWHDIEHRLDAPGCRDLFDDLPSHGYAFLDATRRTLRFSDALAIGLTVLDREREAALEVEVGALLSGLSLHAESGPGGRNPLREILPGDIVATRVETTTVGFGPAPFVMATAVFTLRNLDRLYGGLTWLAPDLGPRLKGRTIEYPVIFFRPNAGPARYVGDGSSCASTRAFRHDLPPDTELGAVERFRITGAFDADDDGAPEVLEVNDRFAYLLEDDGRILVVRVGQGC